MAKKKTVRKKAPAKASSGSGKAPAVRKKAPARRPSQTSVKPATPDKPAQTRALAVACARALDEANCQDIQILDLRSLSQVWDYLVIASGASERQMRTAIEKAGDAAESLGQATFGPRRDRSPTWMVLDFIDVVVHVFEPTTRATYDLELLWGDAPRVDWSPDRASRTARAPR